MNIKAYNSNIITNFFKIILFSIPILFVLGSFYVNLIAFLFSIFFFINFYKIKITFDKKDYIIFFFLIFFLLSNSILSLNPIYSLQKSIFYLRFLFFLISIILILNLLSFKEKKNLVIFFLIINVFFAFDTIIQFFFDTDLFGNKVNYAHAYGRLSGPFGDEYIIGIYFFCFGYLTYAFYNTIYKVRNLHEIVFFLLINILIFLTGERNAFLTSMIFLFFLFLINKNHRKQIFISLILIFVSVFFIIQTSEVLGNKYAFVDIQTISDRSEQKIVVEKKIVEDKKIENSLISKVSNVINNSHHLSHIRAGIKIFKNNTLLGSGFKTFRFACLEFIHKKNITCTSHPHNIYIEILSDTGIIGFFIFVFGIIYLIYNFFKKKLYHDYTSSILISVFIAFVFPLKPHGSIFSTNNAFMFWFILSCVIWSIFYKRENEK